MLRSSSLMLRFAVAAAMHCAVRAVTAAGGFALFFLLDEVYADSSHYGYQNQSNENCADICR